MVDAHRGAHPKPMTSEKDQLRLAENLDGDGALTRGGVNALIETVHKARDAARAAGCDDLMAFATSALRDARNSAEVLEKVRTETGVELEVLPGEDEARFTFLAVRRWCGWSAGRLLVLDIGGGSLELAVGRDEMPEVAESLPLGAGRLTREWFRRRPAAPGRDRRAAGEGAGRPRPGGRADAGRGRAGPGRRDVEDVPVAGPADRRRAVQRGAADAAHADRGRAAPADGVHQPDVERGPGRAGGCEQLAVAPAGGRAPSWRRPRWTRSASPNWTSVRGRCARA